MRISRCVALFLVCALGWYLTSNIAQADLLASALQGHGFDVRVLDSATVQNNWLFGNALGGIRIQVPDDQAEEARAILNGMDFQADPKTLSPNCSSADIHIQKISRRWAFLSILCLGFPLLFISNKMHCRNCGKDWSPTHSN